MAHPRIVQQQMFEWIERCIAADKPVPRDDDIVERFNLHGVDSARSLLADLADQGRINITRNGDKRYISLGAARHQVAGVRDVIPSIVKRKQSAPNLRGARVTDVDELVDRIKAIASRGRVLDNKVQPNTPGAPGTARKAPGAEESTSASRDTVSAPPSSPLRRTADEAVNAGQDGDGEAAQASGVPARHDPAPPSPITMQRLPTAPGRKLRSAGEPGMSTREKRRQLNMHFPPDAYAMLEQRAKTAGKTVSSYARDTFLALLDGQQPAPTKPRVPGAVVKEAIRQNVPVLQLAEHLMNVGLGFATAAEREVAR